MSLKFDHRNKLNLKG